MTGGKKDCKIKEKSFFLLSEQEASAFSFCTRPCKPYGQSWLQGRLLAVTALVPHPACPGLQLLTATGTGGLILLQQASNAPQGKDLTPFTLPRSDRDRSLGMETLECRADLLSRIGSLIRVEARQVPLS